METKQTQKSQAGVIAYRQHKKGIQVILVTALDSDRWVVPKGNVEDHLGVVRSAALEAWEEAGVRGRLGAEPVGEYVYDKHNGRHEEYLVSVYPLEVTEVADDWPERKKRQRKWMSPKQAAKAVQEKKLRQMLETFAPPAQPDQPDDTRSGDSQPASA